MKINTENNYENFTNSNSGNKPNIEVRADTYTNNDSNNNIQENDNYYDDGDLIMSLEERQQKLLEIEEVAPKVVLEVVNKINLPLGGKIQISSTGIENSVRNEKDGITYFGCYNHESNSKDVSFFNIYLLYLKFQ